MIGTLHDLTFLVFSINRRIPVAPLPERELPYLDLTFCLEGEMHYYYNHEHLILHAGDAILLPPGSIRQRLESNAPASYSSFNVQFPADTEFVVTGLIPKAVRSNTMQYLETFQKDFSSVSNYSREKYTLTFLYIYYQLIEMVRDTENLHVQAIKQYIMDHMHSEIFLDDIAKEVHLAPHYCCTLFKKNTGMTIMQYLIFQRIDYAKRLIITKDWSLSKIAENSGFSDYYHFSRTFHKIVGISAVSYRKQNRMKF